MTKNYWAGIVHKHFWNELTDDQKEEYKNRNEELEGDEDEDTRNRFME
jgi:hypothetical protein